MSNWFSENFKPVMPVPGQAACDSCVFSGHYCTKVSCGVHSDTDYMDLVYWTYIKNPGLRHVRDITDRTIIYNLYIASQDSLRQTSRAMVDRLVQQKQQH